jgi:DNA polymerase-3 subunit gamma/tau
MQQLLEQAMYAPSNARFKVYMIDEVHMLTNHAFNSMLKTLEEPPEYIKFILATTDPQKLPVTVLSRCLQFNLKQMPPPQIISHLEDILTQEKVAFEIPALRLLAQGARGSMRDALSLTDQAIAYAAGKITLDAVQTMLGALDQTFLVRMMDALAVKDGAALIAIADEMAARGLSYGVALQDLGTLLHRITLAQTAPSALPDDLPEREDILRLAGLFDAEEIQLFYQIAVHGRNELHLAPDEYAGFTMTLLRMLAFRPSGTNETNGSTPPPKKAAPTSAPSAPSTGSRASGTSPAKAALEAARAKPKAVAAAPTPTPASTSPVTSASPAATRSAPNAQAPATGTPLDWDGNWPQLAAQLPLRGVVQQLAQQTELITWESTGGGASFHLRSPLETLSSPANLDRLGTALSEHFGVSVRVTAEVGKVEQTANKKAMDERAAKQRQAEQTIQSDPFVQSMMREFGATIVPGSIKSN